MPSKTTNSTKKTTKEETKVSNPVEVNNNNSNNNSNNNQDKLMEMMLQMQTTLDSLSSELASTKAELATTKSELAEAKSQVENVTNTSETTSTVTLPTNTITYVNPTQELTSQPSVAERYIEELANRKSNREVTIVHNREILNGCSTHIKLSNIEIDFHALGERRTLSWTQFEECASKYRGFFNREIILVANEHKDVAEHYSLPCVQRNGVTLTRAELEKVGKMSINELTILYNELTKEDKVFLINYWMGQCYNNNPDFRDRSKIEALNALSGTGAFEVFLAYMNGDYMREKNTKEAEIAKKNNPKLNNTGGNFVATV